MKRFPILLFFVALTAACGGSGPVRQQLDRAERLMTDHPDSALAILDAMDRQSLRTPKRQARHALLLSQALDKNYIDVDDDSLISRAVTYYTRRGSDAERARAQYYYAVVKGNAAESGDAIKALLTAREYVDKTDDIQLRGLVYTYLGNLYYEQFCFSDAVAAYTEAVDAFRSTGQTFYLLYVLRRKGVALNLIDKHDEALECLSEAKEAAIEANDTASLLEIMTSIGGIQVAADKIPLPTYKQELFDLYRKYTAGVVPIEHYPVVGYAYYLEKNVDSARWYCSNYCRLQPEITNLNVGILAIMSRIENSAGNFEEALKYERMYVQHFDSLNIITQKNLTSELEGKYEAEYLEKENTALRLIHRYESLSLILTIIVISIGCSIIVGFHKKALRKKNRKIAEYKRYVEEGNEHYAKLAEQYNEIRRNINMQDERSQMLFSLLGNRIKSLQQLLEWASLYEKNTDSFYRHFKEHIKVATGKNRELAEDVIAIANLSCHGIIDRLHEQYPALSLHELCYCGFICLGFSSESIRILYNHTNIYSIYTMRSKIRSKLGLVNQTQNLEKHILHLMKESA